MSCAISQDEAGSTHPVEETAVEVMRIESLVLRHLFV